MAGPAKPRAAPRKRKASELVVTLDEFASICGVTPNTMRSHLKAVPADAPWLLERGRSGVGYKIAAAGGVAWWRARNAGGGEDETKAAAIAELRLAMLGDAGDDEGLLLTGKQRYEEYRAGEAELEYRKSIGELGRVADMEAEVSNAVIELRRQLQRVAPSVRRKLGLAPEVEAEIGGAIEAALVKFVKKLDGDATEDGID